MPVYYDDQPTRITKDPTPGFPLSRYDCGSFIWEDALYGGNYCAVHSSAQGQGGCRELSLIHI